MNIPTFELERIQSLWENVVEYNLSESGVHPLTLNELFHDDPHAMMRLAEIELGYSQTNGTLPLRERIAALYADAGPDQILVACGTAEANFVTIWGLIEAGEELVVMLPNYMQIHGLGRGFRGEVKPFYLRPENNWAPDLDELRRAVTPRTRAIAICNPNNPTGTILSETDRREIVRIAAQVGAWLISDEVYQGAEHDGQTTPSLWAGSAGYERVIITCGLSKAYGLPGLRLGWIVALSSLIAHLWSYRDYTTIAPATLSDRIAQRALETERRAKILERTRSIIRRNYAIVEMWLREHEDLLEVVVPRAGAIALIKYHLPIDSIELVGKMRREQGVLVVPGAHFGLEGYLRLGYGGQSRHLEEGLERVSHALKKWKAMSDER
jgi:aspartate/methionine/tyrosine aminotransferase